MLNFLKNGYQPTYAIIRLIILILLSICSIVVQTLIIKNDISEYYAFGAGYIFPIGAFPHAIFIALLSI